MPRIQSLFPQSWAARGAFIGLTLGVATTGLIACIYYRPNEGLSVVAIGLQALGLLFWFPLTGATLGGLIGLLTNHRKAESPWVEYPGLAVLTVVSISMLVAQVRHIPLVLARELHEQVLRRASANLEPDELVALYENRSWQQRFLEFLDPDETIAKTPDKLLLESLAKNRYTPSHILELLAARNLGSRTDYWILRNRNVLPSTEALLRDREEARKGRRKQRRSIRP